HTSWRSRVFHCRATATTTSPRARMPRTRCEGRTAAADSKRASTSSARGYRWGTRGPCPRWQSPPEGWVSPIGRTAVGTFVVAPRLRTPPDLDAALRLAAHDHDEIRALARLLAQRFVRDDQDRAGRYNLGDAVDGLLR